MLIFRTEEVLKSFFEVRNLAFHLLTPRRGDICTRRRRKKPSKVGESKTYVVRSVLLALRQAMRRAVVCSRDIFVEIWIFVRVRVQYFCICWTAISKGQASVYVVYTHTFRRSFSQPFKTNINEPACAVHYKDSKLGMNASTTYKYGMICPVFDCSYTSIKEQYTKTFPELRRPRVISLLLTDLW